MSPSKICEFLSCNRSTVSRAINNELKSDLAAVIVRLFNIKDQLDKNYFSNDMFLSVCELVIKRATKETIELTFAFKCIRHYNRLNGEYEKNLHDLNVIEVRRDLSEELFFDKVFGSMCEAAMKYAKKIDMKYFIDEMHTLHCRLSDRRSGRHLKKRS